MLFLWRKLRKEWFYYPDNFLLKNLFCSFFLSEDEYARVFKTDESEKKDVNNPCYLIKESNKYIYLRIDYIRFEEIDMLLSELYEVNRNKPLVIDLRDCSGGDFEASIKLCNILLRKTEFKIIFREKELKIEIGEKNKDSKIYCIISEKTMSSGELIAGLIGEQKDGFIIGETSSFGKNTIQKEIAFKSDRLRYTIVL